MIWWGKSTQGLMILLNCIFKVQTICKLNLFKGKIHRPVEYRANALGLSSSGFKKVWQFVLYALWTLSGCVKS